MNSEISKLTMGTGRFCTTCYWTNCAVGLELLNYNTQPPATNQAAVIISFSNKSKYQTIHKLTFWGKACRNVGKREVYTAEFLSTLYMITEALICLEFFTSFCKKFLALANKRRF